MPFSVPCSGNYDPSGAFESVGLADVPPDFMQLFGFDIALLGYQGTVIPVLLAVYIMSKVEKGTRKIVPHAFDLLVTPFVTVIVTGFITFIAIGPLGRAIGSGITVSLTYVYDHAGIVAGLLFGGLYPLIVLTGVHHSFHAIEYSSLIWAETISFLSGRWRMSLRARRDWLYFS